jgi:hypothetical protein
MPNIFTFWQSYWTLRQSNGYLDTALVIIFSKNGEYAVTRKSSLHVDV